MAINPKWLEGAAYQGQTCEVCYERPATHVTEVIGSNSADAINLACDVCAQQARKDPDIEVTEIPS